MRVCAYLLCRVGCCGRRRADAPACPGSWGHRYPPPGSVNGSESTARPCGKARHSPTPRCNKHTDRKKEGEIFSMVPIMINYCWILHQTGEKNTIEQIGDARHKADSKHFQVKHFFLVLFCCVCKSTKLNEKEIREICVEMLFSDIIQTDYILNRAFFWRRLKCALDLGHGFPNMWVEAQNGSPSTTQPCLFWWAGAWGRD